MKCKNIFPFLSLLLIITTSLGQITASPDEDDGNDVIGSAPSSTAKPKVNKSLNKKVKKLVKKTLAAQAKDNDSSTTTTTPLPPPITEPPKVHLSQRHRLRDDLLTGYDKIAHPIEDHDKPVEVDIGMAVIHVDLDEATSILTVDAWMRLTWTDENLVWNETDYGDITQMHFGEKELWRPDVLLYNNADSVRTDPYGSAHFLVQSDGEVLWVPPAHLKAFCKLDMTRWPMDEHLCKLKFGSWTSHGSEIDLGLYHNMTKVELLNFYTYNREWELSDMFASKRTVHYSCCPEGYPEVTFKLNLRRNAPAYKAVIILPCLVIMLMTICSYLLPPNAGEKLFLNGFAFVACILYLLFFAVSLPFHQTKVPIIIMFYSNTCALVGIGMLLNAACINMSRIRRYSGPPKFLKAFFAGSFGRLLCLGNYAHQTSSTHQRLVLELTDMAESEQGGGTPDGPSGGSGVADGDDDDDRTIGLPKPDYEQSGIMRDWILVAAGLERLFFLIYTIIFAVVTTTYI